MGLAALIFSGIALLFSGFSIYQTSKIAKRGIRISKIEEMLEILHTLNGYYYRLYSETFKLKKGYLKGELNKINLEKYYMQVNELGKINEEDGIGKKLARLYILNKSYIRKGSLQGKIDAFRIMYNALVSHINYSPKNEIDLSFNEFPDYYDEKLLDFYIEIEKELIKEMQLGNPFYKRKNSEYENDFKKRFSLD